MDLRFFTITRERGGFSNQQIFLSVPLRAPDPYVFWLVQES